jgi:TRAP transporter 4TM/12TM fusion protein
MRELRGKTAWIVAGVAIFASLFHLYTAGFGTLEPRIQRAMHIILLLPLCFLLYPANKKSPKDRPSRFDILFAVGAVLVSAYIIIANDRLNARWEHVSPVTNVEVVFGTIATILVIEAARRAVSPFLAGLAVLGLLYYLYLGSLLSGFFHTRAISYARFIESLYLLQLEGVYGMLTGVSASYVVIFILFGAVIAEVGVGDYFMSLGKRVAGWAAGGPAKIAVLSSSLFGTISGIAVANVYATGSFTIPMMKKLGYRPQFAGAVEATASTGGQIMPPVMGVAAFIIAEYLNIPYFAIAKAAILPAILFYLGCGFQVHFEAKKWGLVGMPLSELPKWRTIGKDSFLLIPVVFLIGTMMLGYSTFMAVFFSIFICLAIGVVGIILKKKEVALTLPKLIRAFEEGGKNSIMIAIACSVADVFTTSMSQSGLALSFTSIVTSISGNNLFGAMLLVAFACLILGMGTPTVVAYILCAAIGVPVMIKLGAAPLPAHLFVFYYAVIGCVTPPVCVSAYAGASIAGSDPMKTGWEATKLALAGFLVPFAFVYDPSLLLMGSTLMILKSFLLCTIGIFAIAIGLTGFFLRKINLIASLLLVFAGITLFYTKIFHFIHAFSLIFIFITLFIQFKTYFRSRSRKYS